MSVKISELPILSSLADNDVIAGVDTSANVTSKIEMATLKNYIDTNTQYTAGTNIDITNNVVSAPNVYNKTETNNLLNAKENISNKVTTLSSSSTNTQYPSAKVVYDELNNLETDLTNDINDLNDEVDNQIQELEEELKSVSTIFNAFPTESDEDESMTLDGTAEVKFKKFDLKGNTSQDGTPTPTSPIPVNVVSGDNSVVVCGKNLLNLGNKNEATDNRGLTYKVENNIITISGTNTSSSSYSLTGWVDDATQNYYNGLFQKGRTFTLSVNNNNIAGLYFQFNYFKEGSSSQSALVTFSDFSGKATFTIPQDFSGVGNVFLGVYGTATTINGDFSIQLENGSSATDFEPYQGNTYNIDLPVENLLQNNLTSGTINGITYAVNEDKSVTLSGTATSITWLILNNNLPLEAGTYTMSQGYTGNDVRMYSTGLGTYTVDGVKTITKTTSVSGDVSINIPNGTVITTPITIKPMITKSSKANSYTPYGTTPIELCKIGNYQDYFYKDSDKWYLHKIIYKKIFNDTDTIEVTGTSTTRTLIAYNTGITLESYAGGSVVPNILCTHLISASQGATWVPGDISRRYQNPMSLFYILEADLTTTTALQWLVNNNVVTYTPMAEPIVTEITYQSLIDQLNLLEKAMSKDGQTNISQVNNDKPFILDVTAIKSLQNVLDRIELLES